MNRWGSADQKRELRSRLPLFFAANQGQFAYPPAFRFVADGDGCRFALLPDRMLLTYLTVQDSRTAHGVTLDLEFVHASPHAALIGSQQEMGSYHYLRGSDPRGHLTHVPIYREAVYRELWPGIDAHVRGEEGSLKLDWVVRPGHSPSGIAMKLRGADQAWLDEEGNLLVHTDYGLLKDSRPYAYQRTASGEQPVGCRFTLKKAEADHGWLIGFDTSSYDPALPLVIDPVIVFSTYLGGSGADSTIMAANTLEVTGDDHAILVGNTNASSFPVTAGAFQTTLQQGIDVTVTKFTPDGSGIVFSTYLGGSGFEIARGLELDALNNIYVCGSTTSTNFPTTPSSFMPVFPGGTAAFVTKLNSTGTALLFSTYLGGTGEQTRLFDIALDDADNPIVVGSTGSSSYPTTPGAFQTAFTGTECSILTKLNASGTGLLYSTFVGGTASSRGTGITLDGSGLVYVCGTTDSTDFPTTPGALQVTAPPGTSTFVYAMNASATSLVFSTYLGGSGTEDSADIAIGSLGQVVVCGSTTSADFPTTPGALQPALLSETCGFVSVLASSGSSLNYSTYIGGAGGDTHLLDLTIRPGFVLFVGDTESPNFPVTVDALQPALTGVTSAVVGILAAAGELVYASYLGGSAEQTAFAAEFIPGSPSAIAYIAGTTNSADFPVTPGAYDTAPLGNQRLFLVKFAAVSDVFVTKTPSQTQVTRGSTVTYSITVRNTGVVGASTDPTLTNVTIVDAGLGINVNIGTLTAGQTGGTSGTFTVPADAPFGRLTNRTVVTADQLPAPRIGEAFIQVVPAPSVDFTKTVSPDQAPPGGEVVFTLTVRNTGDVPLQNAVLSDPLLGLSESLNVIAPGATSIVEVPFAIPADAAIGTTLANSATLVADGLVPQRAAATVQVTDIPRLTLLKSADRRNAVPGDTVQFAIAVRNTGRVALTNVVVNDDMLGLQQTIPSLKVGDSREFAVSQIVPLESPPGIYVNTATASSDQTEAISAEYALTVAAAPRVGLRKVPSPASASPGQQIQYTVSISNFGNVPLTNVRLSDPLLGVSLALPDIPVGQLARRLLPFTIPLNAPLGSEIVNELTVMTAETGPQTVQSSVSILGAGLALTKHASLPVAPPGTVVSYTLTAANLLPALQTNVVLRDPLLGIDELVPILQIGETLERTATLATPIGAANGSVVRNAFVAFSAQSAPQVTTADVVVRSVPGAPTTIAVRKLADRNVAEPGEEIVFTVEITNTGANPATDLVVSDALIGSVQTIPVLAPGAAARLLFPFRVPPDATTATVISNRATVRAAEAPAVQSEFRVAVALPRTLLQFTNMVDKPVANPGETVFFTVTVQNQAELALTNVLVVEPLTDFSARIPALAVGEQRSFVRPFTLPADTVGGTVFSNPAFAFSDQTPLQSQTATVTAAELPNVVLTHAVAPTIGQSGDIVQFEIGVRNTGNVDLLNALLVAPLLQLRVHAPAIPIGTNQRVRIPFKLPQVDFDEQLVSVVVLTSDNGPEREASAVVTVFPEEEE
ncbi:DUF11 domain-containing protein [Paenibacillus lycopersici]|uniref:DUF11 domain-containing protein n=1 Tax=Paenibacillus lycopersici TaxID=2704462 RepID=A0A6C0G4U0_9BACL|nr:SBBP repeat-containing protein [Paenibacillus lycopersici]QHT63263.1 DUF11 domain-containing protein [Paenibacillus lycopersici]